MTCPRCQSNNYKKSGKTKLGYQRYQCNDCKKYWNDANLKGRPTRGLTPMSGAERSRRYRQRKKIKDNS